MAASPIFTGTPQRGVASISSADTSLTSSSGTTAFTAGSSGARIDQIIIQATGTTTAGQVRVFLELGGTHTLLAEVPVTAIVASATVSAFRYVLSFSNGYNQNGLVIPATTTVRFATHNAESFKCHVFAGDF
jgi:hypothetical protein